MFHTRFDLLLPFLTSKNTYISIRDKNRFPKKTLVSTLVSFNPRNVLLVFRLILVHGKITHPDSADEVLDLFFKGETPPHVSADGYWNFSVKLEIHPMVLSKKNQTLRNVSPPLCFAINNTSSQCLHRPPPPIFAPLCFDFARAAKAWTSRKKQMRHHNPLEYGRPVYREQCGGSWKSGQIVLLIPFPNKSNNPCMVYLLISSIKINDTTAEGLNIPPDVWDLGSGSLGYPKSIQIIHPGINHPGSSKHVEYI